MKTNLLILITLLIISCQTKNIVTEPDYVLFSGKIKNRNSDSLVIKSDKEVLHTLKLNEDGTFSDTLHNIKEAFYTLFDGGEYATLFLKPGYTLSMTLDATAFDETLAYEGKGAEENNYLIKKVLVLEDFGNRLWPNYHANLTEKDFLALMDSVNTSRKTLFNNYKNLDSAFHFLQEAEITIDYTKALALYENIKRNYTEDTSFTVSSSFPNPFESININDDRLLGISSFIDYVEIYCENKVEKENSDQKYAFLDVLERDVTNTVVREKLAYNRGMQAIKSTENLDEFYDKYAKLITEEKNKKNFYEKYLAFKKIEKGNVSPNFELYDLNNNLISLSSLKGKYVYIDIWATWCSPCIAEMPHLKELEKEFGNNTIVFVGMCLEKSEEKWKKMVNEKGLEGIQLIVKENDNNFIESYVVESIPRFILLDTEGKIVNANEKRPSDPELKKLFKTLGSV